MTLRANRSPIGSKTPRRLSFTKHPCGSLLKLSVSTFRECTGATTGFGQPSRRELSVGDLSLTFQNGKAIKLGIDQTRLYDDDDDLARTDALVDTVRAHSGL
jgi:hypothetical protein